MSSGSFQHLNLFGEEVKKQPKKRLTHLPTSGKLLNGELKECNKERVKLEKQKTKMEAQILSLKEKSEKQVLSLKEKCKKEVEKEVVKALKHVKGKAKEANKENTDDAKVILKAKKALEKEAHKVQKALEKEAMRLEKKATKVGGVGVDNSLIINKLHISKLIDLKKEHLLMYEMNNYIPLPKDPPDKKIEKKVIKKVDDKPPLPMNL